MFIAALFTVAKTWKQPKCPLIDDWVKIWYIYNEILLSARKDEVLSLVTTWMDLENIVRSKTSQMEEVRNHKI